MRSNKASGAEIAETAPACDTDHRQALLLIGLAFPTEGLQCVGRAGGDASPAADAFCVVWRFGRVQIKGTDGFAVATGDTGLRV